MEFTLAFNHRKTFEQTKQGLISLLFFFAFTRGFFQLVVPKPLTMLTQLVGVAGICLYFLIKAPMRWNIQTRSQLSLIVFFTGVVLCSAFWTIFSLNDIKWFVYFFFTAFFLLQFLFSLNLYLTKEQLISLPNVLLFWGWTLFIFAILEQLKVVSLPGHSRIWFLVRPASLTGSMLHYPIIMALLGGLFFSFYRESKRRLHFWTAVVFSFVPFSVLSRSGIFIVGMFFLLTFIQLPIINMRKFLKILFCIFSVFLAVSLIYSAVKANAENDEESLPSLIFTRVTSSIDKKAKGNSTRVTTWNRVKKEWAGTNLVVGERMGEYTNSTAFLNREGRSKISESSVLQQLMNFGFLGTFSFYVLLLMPLWKMGRESFMYRSIYIAGLMQTAFVQSIEVVSYMTLLLLIPWFSQLDFSEQRSLPQSTSDTLQT